MHNRIELGALVDDAPQPVSETMVRVRLRQMWSYSSKGKRKDHIQRIYCVFLGDTVATAKQLSKGDNVWIVGQLIRRALKSGELDKEQSPRESFTFEIHVIDAHVITPGQSTQPLPEVPEQERMRQSVRGNALHPFFAETAHDWPV